MSLQWNYNIILLENYLWYYKNNSWLISIHFDYIYSYTQGNIGLYSILPSWYLVIL